MVKFNLFNWFELPLVLLSIFILIFSFTNGIGLFIFPILAIVVAGSILRWVDPDDKGFMFAYHSLALSGVFLVILIIVLYRTLAPIFQF